MSLLYPAGHQFGDTNLDPVGAGKLYVYDNGTTNEASVYSNPALTASLSNPIVLDSSGRLTTNVYVDGSVAYTVKLNTSGNAELWSRDDVWGVIDLTDAIEKQDNDASGNTTGATVKHHDNNFYDVGMNVMPSTSVNSSTTLNEIHAGTFVRMTGASAGVSLTETTNNCPEGTTFTVMNANASTALTITQGTGQTLTLLDGGGGTTTGSRTLAAKGVCTIVKRGSADWYIWGVGLT